MVSVAGSPIRIPYIALLTIAFQATHALPDKFDTAVGFVRQQVENFRIKKYIRRNRLDRRTLTHDKTRRGRNRAGRGETIPALWLWIYSRW